MSFGIQGITSVFSALSQLSTPSTSANSLPPATNPFDSTTGPFANLNLTAAQKTQVDSIVSTAQNQGLSFSQINSQIYGVLTPTQQQTFQSDLQQLQGQHPHHHHHGSSGDSPESTSLLSQLGLSSEQQNQIAQIVQNAQASGLSSNGLITQIGNVLSGSQQTQLANLLSTTTYTAGGAATPTNPSYLVNTSA